MASLIRQLKAQPAGKEFDITGVYLSEIPVLNETTGVKGAINTILDKLPKSPRQRFRGVGLIDYVDGDIFRTGFWSPEQAGAAVLSHVRSQRLEMIHENQDQ